MKTKKHLSKKAYFMIREWWVQLTGKKAHKKPLEEQAPLFDKKFEQKAGEQIEPAQVEQDLSPIIDRKTYDKFIKAISLRVYLEFEKTMREEGVQRPEIVLVGFDLKKTTTEMEVRMSNYVALNARLILEKAFVDRYDYVTKHMPRVMREMHEAGSSDVSDYMESKVQHDLMMEIRSIAMVHIPEDQRFSYISKLKVL
jgi:hypothetical protein